MSAVPPRIFCSSVLALLAACPFAPMGVDTTPDDTTSAGPTTSPDDPTGPIPTSSTSEDTTGVVPDTTTGSTSGSTTGPDTDATDTDVVPTCADPQRAEACSDHEQPIHEDFEDLNFRCAVDRAIEGTEDEVDCEFTCGEAQALLQLEAIGRGITCTLGMRHLRNVTFLSLPNNQITEAVDFHALPNLTDLYLNSNKLESTAGLDELVNLQVLELDSNAISSITLPTSHQLTLLSLESNLLTSLDGLPSLPVLSALSLGANPMLPSASLKVLETQTPALTALYVADINLTSPADVPHIDSLLTLDIGLNGLSSLAGLHSFPNLTTLRIHGNEFVTVSEAEVPLTLQELDLSNNKLDSGSLDLLSEHMGWLDDGDLIRVTGNTFMCGPPFDEAVARFGMLGVSLEPDPLVCVI